MVTNGTLLVLFPGHESCSVLREDYNTSGFITLEPRDDYVITEAIKRFRRATPEIAKLGQEVSSTVKGRN